jgi:hypothetical protein
MMMIGFAVKAPFILSRRFGWRCSRITLDRHLSALAIGQNISLCRFISGRNFLALAARTMKSAVHLFCELAFFVDAPGMIG